MRSKRLQNYVRRGFAGLLSLAVGISGWGFVPSGSRTVQAANGAIAIDSAAKLAKIGVDANYPLSGDYVLTRDIELTGNWTPIGGLTWADYGLDSGSGVFTGTLDGQGHVISRLTIKGTNSSGQHSLVGLFAAIGSANAKDYAEVKNLVFTDVDIDYTVGNLDGIGTLAGDVNGYVKIDNIAVASGSVTANNTSGDLTGVGGIIAETKNNSEGVQLTNLYNAASVTLTGRAAGNSGSSYRCGGIIGRIHTSTTIGKMSACVNVGTVTHVGSQGYALNGVDNTSAVGNYTNISKCYYLAGSGLDLSHSVSKTEAGLASAEVVNALDADYWHVTAAGKLEPVVMSGKVLPPIPSPVFATGDRENSVTKNFTLPLSYTGADGTEKSITWTSSKPDVVEISGGEAVVKGVLADTNVTLTAVTGDGRTKQVRITVCSTLTLQLNKEYANAGDTLTASVANAPEGTAFTYTWKRNTTTLSSSASYTVKESDMYQFLTITAYLNGSEVDSFNMFLSDLPVVYVNTDDGYAVTSKTEYKDASMRIQGNDIYNSTTTTMYDGKTEIRGRGNSTWSGGQAKKPYKLKLDSKTDLFGFGESKHWTLLANYMDESLMRNLLSYNFSGDIGMIYLPSANVELIFNGSYAGNYQLVGNVRIEKSRVDVFDWEDCAEDAAKAVYKIHKDEGMTKDERDAIEDYLKENLSYITANGFTYQGKTYPRSDYESVIPKDENGDVDVSGGFLFELDEYWDEISKFKTAHEQPINFKAPEYAKSGNSCSALSTYGEKYIQAVEDSFYASDYCVTYNGKKQHYTDLVDMDSLVRYYVVNEFFWNTETMKKSTFMYKDLGEKLFIGPIWDMDWTSNSLVSAGETGNPQSWMVNRSGTTAQANSWYKKLVADPYFVTKVYECFKENEAHMNAIIRDNGYIDQNIDYLMKSGKKNYENGYTSNGSSEASFPRGAERLKEFLVAHKAWLDRQFTSVGNLLSSYGKYSSGGITVSANTAGATKTTYTATVTGSNVAKVSFIINGYQAGTANVSGGKASITVEDSLCLEKKDGANNVVQVYGLNSSGSLVNNVKGYKLFTKELAAAALTGTASISGTPQVGQTLTAALANSNNSGELTYRWKADGAVIEGASGSTLTLTAELEGKVITVEIGSTVETGKITSAATAAVQAVPELRNDHLIINQVYGGGAKDDADASHSFIELYNPTDAEIDLSGYTLGYLSNGKNGPATEEVTLDLSGKKIPSHYFYLIRCEEDNLTNAAINIWSYDQEWTQAIDNKRYRVTLYHAGTVQDAVSVNEGDVEGAALPDGTINKHTGIRRINFADTNNNQNDFEALDYSAEVPAEKHPKSLAYGEGGLTPPTPPVTVDKLTGTVTITGEAKVGETLTANVADTNNSGELSYQWLAGGAAIAGATGQTFVLTDEQIGKTVTVQVQSSVETGTLVSAPTAMVVGNGETVVPLEGEVSIRGNAIVGAHLYADPENIVGSVDENGDDAEEFLATLSYQWKADGEVIANADGPFLTLEKSSIGKKITVTVTSSIKDGALTAPQTAQVVEKEAQTDHLIINQVYGIGKKSGTPLSHSFIELYNPTGTTVSLNGYAIIYNDGKEDALLVLTPDGGEAPQMAAHTSYLIRCNEGTDTAITLDTADMDWDQRIDNKLYSVKLMRDGQQIDGISVNNGDVEGTAFPDDSISKNKSVRRISLIDTDANTEDFEILNYSKLPEEIKTEVLPRSQKDGAWGMSGGTGPVVPDPEKPTEEQKQALLAGIQTAESAVQNQSAYTEESYSAFREAYEAAKSLDLTAATAEEVENARRKLDEAYRALVKKPDIWTDKPTEEQKQQLTQTIQTAETAAQNQSIYTPESYEPFRQALEAAKLLDPATATAEEVRRVQEALAKAYQNLVKASSSVTPPPTVQPPKAGTKLKDKKALYKVTKSGARNGTVTLVKPLKATNKSFTIPASVTIDKITYKVTAIAAKAFRNNKKLVSVVIGKNVKTIGKSAFEGAKKLKKITVKSAVLKKVGRNALKNINAKCRIRVPKAKLKAYTKILKKKGQKSSVKITK